MAYYLSKRNQRLLSPYLKLLELSNKSVTLKSDSPDTLRNLLRSAFNTSHPHLKDKYKIKIKDSQVICEITISLEFENVKETAEFFDIATDIMNNNIPIKYQSVSLNKEDYESLVLLSESKSLKLTYNPPILEISYA